jgi:hypothetical protein
MGAAAATRAAKGRRLPSLPPLPQPAMACHLRSASGAPAGVGGGAPPSSPAIPPGGPVRSTLRMACSSSSEAVRTRRSLSQQSTCDHQRCAAVLARGDGGAQCQAVTQGRRLSGFVRDDQARQGTGILALETASSRGRGRDVRLLPPAIRGWSGHWRRVSLSWATRSRLRFVVTLARAPSTAPAAP